MKLKVTCGTQLSCITSLSQIAIVNQSALNDPFAPPNNCNNIILHVAVEGLFKIGSVKRLFQYHVGSQHRRNCKGELAQDALSFKLEEIRTQLDVVVISDVWSDTCDSLYRAKS